MKAQTNDAAAKPSGRAAVLDTLKRAGPMSADALAKRLGITAAAVRQHLAGLEADGLAAAAAQAPKTRGRPLALWRTTEAANARFADSHSLLAIDLLGQMKEAFGADGLDRLLGLRTQQQERAYRAELAKATTLKARLTALVRIRNREGYMAELKRDGGAYVLIENHCPICAAARICQGLCREELVLFRRLLGEDVTVSRTDHVLAGAGRCAYHIVSA